MMWKFNPQAPSGRLDASEHPVPDIAKVFVVHPLKIAEPVRFRGARFAYELPAPFQPGHSGREVACGPDSGRRGERFHPSLRAPAAARRSSPDDVTSMKGSEPMIC